MKGAKLKVLTREMADAQKAVTRCAECRWYYRGSVRDGKAAFQAHRNLRHS